MNIYSNLDSTQKNETDSSPPSNRGIKKYKFYAEKCPGGQLGKQREWTKTWILLLFKVDRERGNLTPESYFNKNPAGKAKSGNENMYFLGIIIASNYEFV